MAFPSSTGTKKALSGVLGSVQTTSTKLKNKCEELNALASAGNVSAFEFISMATYLADARLIFTMARSVPGIGPFAQQDCNDPSLDIAAEFTAMMAELDNTLSAIVNGFPKDASGWLLYTSFDANGRYVYRQLTPAQTASIRTNLTALISAIN